MIAQSKLSTETRGRPRKEQTRTLSPIYKEMFSDNSAIIHSSFLIYVFEVFVQTKNQKRVGHKDGGFTIYDKINNEYCFDNLDSQLQEWGCYALLKNQNMRGFAKLLPALGPKIILRQICKLVNFIVENESEGHSEQYILHELTHINNQQRLNEQYSYMRFVPRVLKQLKMDKNQRWDRSNNLFELIRQRVDYLWEPLIRIIIHTVFNCIEGKIHNKYFKPFFSDAENPGQTYIGQLNLDQVVMSVRRQETQDRSNRGSEANIQEDNFDKLRKVRSIAGDQGNRTIVRIIKAPEATGGINLKQSDNIGLVMQSPAKISRLQSQPLLFQQGGGFSTVFKPRVIPSLSAEKNDQFKLEAFDKIYTPKSQVKFPSSSQNIQNMQINLQSSPSENKINQNIELKEQVKQAKLQKQEESKLNDAREASDKQQN